MTACISVTPCGWSIFAIAFRASPEEPSPGTARCPRQNAKTSPYQAVTPAQAAVLRPHYRLSLVKHQRSLTMFLLTRHE